MLLTNSALQQIVSNNNIVTKIITNWKTINKSKFFKKQTFSIVLFQKISIPIPKRFFV